MKTLITLTLAALMSAGAAFAAHSSSPPMPSATPAGTATPASKSADRHHSIHSMAYCEKRAREKSLSGDAEKTFVQDCRAGKKTG